MFSEAESQSLSFATCERQFDFPLYVHCVFIHYAFVNLVLPDYLAFIEGTCIWLYASHVCPVLCLQVWALAFFFF